MFNVFADDITGMVNKFSNDNIKDKVSELSFYKIYLQIHCFYLFGGALCSFSSSSWVTMFLQPLSFSKTKAQPKKSQMSDQHNKLYSLPWRICKAAFQRPSVWLTQPATLFGWFMIKLEIQLRKKGRQSPESGEALRGFMLPDRQLVLKTKSPQTNHTSAARHFFHTPWDQFCVMGVPIPAMCLLPSTYPTLLSLLQHELM